MGKQRLKLQIGTLLAFLIFGISGQAQQGNCVVSETSFGISFGGFGGPCGGQVSIGYFASQRAPISPGMKTEISKGPNGEVRMSVSPVRFADLESQKPRAKRPRAIQIHADSSERIISEFTEIEQEEGRPGKRIFLGSRHSLQSIHRGGLRQALDQIPDLKGVSYRIFAFEFEGVTLDAILLVPANSTDANADLIGEIKRFFQSDLFTEKIEPQDLFYSYQMSANDSGAFKQDSLGAVARVGLYGEKLHLPVSGDNYTAPGSSGSLVFIRPRASDNKRSDWKVGGIVSCGVTQKSRDPEGLRFTAIEVITSRALLSSEIYEVTEESVNREPKIENPRCIPLDGRGGGG